MRRSKKFFIIIFKIVLNFVYKVLSTVTVTEENKAIFVLSRENKLQGNLQFVFFELKRQCPNIKIHFIHAENKMNLKLFKEIITVSNARYLILDDYYLPVYLIKPKKSLKIIQLWHAAGAFKKVGYSTIGTKFGPNEQYLNLVPIHSNYTHVYVSSENVIPYYAEAFNMSKNNIYALGMPRTDMFSDNTYKQKVLKTIFDSHAYFNNEKKVNILIAPTYRAIGRYEESALNIAMIIKQEAQKINNNIQILFRPHPYTKTEDAKILKNIPNVHIVNDLTINDWMLVSDAFITDYSSAIFDFAMLHKPFAHYVPDIKDYEKNRGFYEDIDVISKGIIITEVEKLILWMNERKKDEFYNTEEMIKYNFKTVNNVTENIVKHFIEN